MVVIESMNSVPSVQLAQGTVRPSVVPGLEAGTLSIVLTLQIGFAFANASVYDGISFRLWGEST